MLFNADCIPWPHLTKLQSLSAKGSGVARTSPMLGHSMGTLRLYELTREVQKLLGVSGGTLPQKT